MILDKLYVRFYRSFNFDYLRKTDRRVENKLPWEFLKNDHDEKEQAEEPKKKQWYPFVTIPLDCHITTVVGENESGKTCLLKAIEHGVSGDKIQQRDFCRHSAFFTVEEGKERLPEFGCRWSFSSSEEREAVVARCGLPEDTSFLLVFHTSPSGPSIYVQRGTEVVEAGEAVSPRARHALQGQRCCGPHRPRSPFLVPLPVPGSSRPPPFRIDSKMRTCACPRVCPPPNPASPHYLTANRDRRPSTQRLESHAQWRRKYRPGQRRPFSDQRCDSAWIESLLGGHLLPPGDTVGPEYLRSTWNGSRRGGSRAGSPGHPQFLARRFPHRLEDRTSRECALKLPHSQQRPGGVPCSMAKTRPFSRLGLDREPGGDSTARWRYIQPLTSGRRGKCGQGRAR